jgi:hypothetical protein
VNLGSGYFLALHARSARYFGETNFYRFENEQFLYQPNTLNVFHAVATSVAR